MDSIKVFAPASVSNVGCGFDVMGFAIEKPGDELVLSRRDEPGVSIVEITGDHGRLPRETHRNTAGVAVEKYLQGIQSDQGINLAIHKKMPFGSGLGSSAASAVGAVFGANLLAGQPLTSMDLVQFALDGEQIASGSRHADNVAPAMLGGFVLVRSCDPIDIVRLHYPRDLWVSIIYPHIEISTREARNLMGDQVPLKSAIAQWGNVGSLVAGLHQEDYDLIGRAIKDHIAEPIRSRLIPVYAEVKGAALDGGALGCNISGSGPSIFALCRGPQTTERVAQKMKEVYDAEGITTTLFISPVNHRGPILLD